LKIDVTPTELLHFWQSRQVLLPYPWFVPLDPHSLCRVRFFSGHFLFKEIVFCLVPAMFLDGYCEPFLPCPPRPAPSYYRSLFQFGSLFLRHPYPFPFYTLAWYVTGREGPFPVIFLLLLQLFPPSLFFRFPLPQCEGIDL